MGYYQAWNEQLAAEDDPQAVDKMMERYYALETEAYSRVLAAYPEVLSAPANELADQLGFSGEMVIFAGFLDGIHASLKQPLDLENLNDNTPVTLDADYEKLLWNMHEAKADWLVELPAWEHVLPPERRREIAKDFRLSRMAVRTHPGRNDPCSCGSGKKFKHCCGK